MARRDRTLVPFPTYLPRELKLMAERYQSNRNLPSLNQAIIELLETHPAIAQLIAEVYSVSGT